MDECGNSRCLLEKRYFKKELLSWCKKIPFTIGLEMVAESLAGSSSGHIKTLLLPFNDMEPETATDFTTEDKCPLCLGKPETIPLDIPDAPEKTSIENGSSPLISFPNRSHPRPPEVPADMDGLSSFYNQLAMTSFFYQQQQKQQLLHNNMLNQQSAFTSAYGEMDSPLDLSGNQLSGMEQESLRVPEIRIKKKKDVNARRSYTDKELSAAVEAIQSGVIGTRRAAQLYGVPRSTLRNKVFKAAEMSRHPGDSKAYIDSRDENTTTSPPAHTSKSVSPTASTADREPKAETSDMAGFNASLFKQLERARGKQAIDMNSIVPPHPAFSADMFNPLQFGYPFMMPHFPGSLLSGFDYMNPYAASIMMPFLPDIVKNLTQKRLDAEKPSSSASASRTSPATSHFPADKDDLKVPAYKPSSSEVKTEPAISHAMQNIISKDSPHRSSPSYLHGILPRVTAERLHAERAAAEKEATPSKKFKSDTPSPSSQQLSQNGTTGKKRPKRGQYRKYDSELLAQAVRAVQRGEMSVHRAGTFFGVPHSTLEYKVKERHLLRKKKLAETSENKEKCVPTTSSTCSSDSCHSEKLKLDLYTSNDEESKTSPPPSASQCYSDFPVPYPGFPELNSPASDLLKKLHERAQEKANALLGNSSKESDKSKCLTISN